MIQAKDERELAFNAVPDSIAIIDCSHRLSTVNRAMANRFKTQPEDWRIAGGKNTLASGR